MPKGGYIRKFNRKLASVNRKLASFHLSLKNGIRYLPDRLGVPHRVIMQAGYAFFL